MSASISSPNGHHTTFLRGWEYTPTHSIFLLGFIYHAYPLPPPKSGQRGWRMQDFCRLHIYLFIYLHTLASPAYKNGIHQHNAHPPPTLPKTFTRYHGTSSAISQPSHMSACICLFISLLSVDSLFNATIYPHTHLSLPRRSFPSVYV